MFSDQRSFFRYWGVDRASPFLFRGRRHIHCACCKWEYLNLYSILFWRALRTRLSSYDFVSVVFGTRSDRTDANVQIMFVVSPTSELIRCMLQFVEKWNYEGLFSYSTICSLWHSRFCVWCVQSSAPTFHEWAQVCWSSERDFFSGCLVLHRFVQNLQESDSRILMRVKLVL